jgi:hypothetical protein
LALRESGSVQEAKRKPHLGDSGSEEGVFLIEYGQVGAHYLLLRGLACRYQAYLTFHLGTDLTHIHIHKVTIKAALKVALSVEGLV